MAVDASGGQVKAVFEGTRESKLEAARADRMIAKEPALAIVNGKQQVFESQFGFTLLRVLG